MSLITCLAWVPKGYAASNPVAEKVTAEDLAEIKAGEGVDMDMDNYENEECLPEFAGVDYEPQLENYKDESEEEDNIIHPNDCILVAGVQNGDFSELHVYVYVQETSSLYVHHDIILPAYPLSLQWLPYNPKTPSKSGNCLAVGGFYPEIEIWDLDVLESLEPVSRMGGLKRVESQSGKKRKKTKTYKTGSHHDAVLSLHMHPTRNNLLASGSADKKVKIWDVIENKCKSTFDYHQDKVQGVKWHPNEEKILASAGIEGHIFIKSADNPTANMQTSVPSSIENVAWNPFLTNQLSVSTEDGYFYTYDVRSINKPVYEAKLHSETCGFSYSPGLDGLLATAGKDKMVKIWDARNMELVAERNVNVDELFCIEFYKDCPFILATGGLGGEIAIWDTEENSAVSSRWNNA
ncbi:hypothetical protein SteCoe_28303 [Stentor coeruleus]|uniref:Uncharacterized protein n=1 Tax=Stentor coeruleus TaxID=5963 RepID=A0A1R2B929_9CILI|nr:hypothetical protein SteCoe_28303 [Stentor coeruleus]